MSFLTKPRADYSPSDPELLVKFREAITEKKGKRVKDNNYNIINKPPQGTNKAYTLTRLAKDAPELFEKVKAGELIPTANRICSQLRQRPTIAA